MIVVYCFIDVLDMSVRHTACAPVKLFVSNIFFFHISWR